MTDSHTTQPEPLSERDSISSTDIELVRAGLCYQIRACGTQAGSIEGVPGYMEYICLYPHLEGKGIARATLEAFVEESLQYGETDIKTSNATNEKMAHILETEPSWEQTDLGWRWSGDAVDGQPVE